MLDCLLLQLDLNNLDDYCKINELTLNLDKCFQISFTRNNKLVQYNYNINSHILEAVDSIKDLGVTFDSKINFALHIEGIVHKC